ncbi:MAG: class I SAM-dependent RNA methyltransferase, partial [Pseudolabrys sp.]
LERAGVAAAVGDIVDAHGAGRRRATFHARRGVHDILEFGYAAPRAHHIVPIDRCPILAPSMTTAIDTAWAIAEAIKPAGKPLDIQVTAADNGLDIDVRGSGPLNLNSSAVLAQIAAKCGLARLTRHGELVAQQAPPQIAIGRAKVTLPPGAFLQATTEGEAALARLVLQYAGPAKAVADLFCGVGPFALRLAETARVAAFDNDAAAVHALKQAAATASGLKPVNIHMRDLFRQPLVASELKPFTAVVFDPPRQGAEAQARELAQSKVPAVIAVSCDATTFARDARILMDGGYRLEAVTPVDQFRYSPHVEIVARFAK